MATVRLLMTLLLIAGLVLPPASFASAAPSMVAADVIESSGPMQSAVAATAPLAQQSPGTGDDSTPTLTQILITIDRTTYTDKSTIGVLDVYINGVDQQLNAYSLEPATSGDVSQFRAILAGTYSATINDQSKFGEAIKLEDRNGRTDIEIHPGNTAATNWVYKTVNGKKVLVPNGDSTGCALIGKNPSPDALGPGTSRPMFNKLMSIVDNARDNGEVSIQVRVRDFVTDVPGPGADNSDFEMAAAHPPLAQPNDVGDSTCTANLPSLLNGDTHITTFDGLHYDFQAIGEFVLLKSMSDPLQVQVRQQAWSSSRKASISTAVAMNVAGDRVGIYQGRDPALRLNGEPANVPDGVIDLTNGGQLERSGNEYTVVWPDGSVVRAVTGSVYGLSIFGWLPSYRKGRIIGILGRNAGNIDTDLLARDGTPIDASTLSGSSRNGQLYDRFGNSWRITQDESLFDYGDGESADLFNQDRTFPDQAVFSPTLDNAARQAAEAACRQAGVTEGRILDDCILDVGVTGDSGFAGPAAQIAATQPLSIGNVAPQSPAATPQPSAPPPTAAPVVQATPGAVSGSAGQPSQPFYLDGNYSIAWSVTSGIPLAECAYVLVNLTPITSGTSFTSFLRVNFPPQTISGTSQLSKVQAGQYRLTGFEYCKASYNFTFTTTQAPVQPAKQPVTVSGSPAQASQPFYLGDGGYTIAWSVTSGIPLAECAYVLVNLTPVTSGTSFTSFLKVNFPPQTITGTSQLSIVQAGQYVLTGFDYCKATYKFTFTPT